MYQAFRATTTKYHRLGGLNSINSFLAVLEARSPGSRCEQLGFSWHLSSWLAVVPYWPYACIASSLSTHIPSVSSSYKNAYCVGLSTTIIISFDLRYLFQGSAFRASAPESEDIDEGDILRPLLPGSKKHYCHSNFIDRNKSSNEKRR